MVGTELDATPTPRAGRGAGVPTVLWRTALGLGAGAVMILTFARLVSLGAISQRLSHLNVGLALACGVAFLAAYAVRAMRWRRLLAPCYITIGRAIALYQVATFLNWLLPIRAGELAKSLLLRRTDGIPVSQSLATVTLDKAMDLLPVVGLLALLPFVHLHLSTPLWALLMSALAVVAGGVLVLGLAAWRRDRTVSALRRLLAAAVPRRARERIEPFLVRFIDTLLALVRRPRLMLLAAAYTAVAVGLDALFCLLAFRAVGVVVAPAVALYGYTLYNLAYILPTPPGQIGSNEVMGLVIFAGMFGMDRSAVGAMFLFSHPWTAALMAASALTCLSAMGLTMRTTLRLAHDAAEADG